MLHDLNDVITLLTNLDFVEAELCRCIIGLTGVLGSLDAEPNLDF